MAARPLSEVHIPIGPPPEDVETSSAAIRAAFARLATFDVPDDLEFVQGGRGLGECLRAVGRSHFGPLIGQLTVTEVFFLSATTAVVRWKVEMRSPGQSSFAFFDGRAVRVDDGWFVERGTFCELVGRLGIECPPLPTRA